MAGQYDSIVEYLTHGFTIFEELNRNAFTGDAAISEVIIIRCEEFVCGLSLLYRSMRWPEDIKQHFQAAIALFQERIFRILDQFNLDDDEHCQYSCPVEFCWKTSVSDYEGTAGWLMVIALFMEKDCADAWCFRKDSASTSTGI
jgi:hypothetical protein